MQFPVSSGQHHRANESEWVPVVPPKPPKKDKEVQEQSTADTPSVAKEKVASTPQTSAADVPLPTTGTTSIHKNTSMQLSVYGKRWLPRSLIFK